MLWLLKIRENWLVMGMIRKILGFLIFFYNSNATDRVNNPLNDHRSMVSSLNQMRSKVPLDRADSFNKAVDSYSSRLNKVSAQRGQ